MQFNKTKRVLLPGVLSKDIKPLSTLLRPSHLVIPMLLLSILAQISDNLKAVFTPKDIQNIYSVKVYRKLVFFGSSTISLSVIRSISKTLGPELETLSVLNVSERLVFLQDLYLKVIAQKGSGKLNIKNPNFSNPVELMKYRKGLSIRCRSDIFATSVFSPNSVVLGFPVSSIDLNFIVESSKLFWVSLGLLEDDFEFLLKKDVINKIKNSVFSGIRDFSFDTREAVRLLFFFEVSEILNFDKFVDFSIDNIVIHGNNNLVLLEKDLKLIKRDLPDLPLDIFIPEKNLDDSLLRLALEQRRKYKANLESIYSNIGNFSEKKKLRSLKDISFKRFLFDN